MELIWHLLNGACHSSSPLFEYPGPSNFSFSRPLHSTSLINQLFVCFYFSPQLISKILRKEWCFSNASILQRAWHVTNSSSWGWVWQAVWAATGCFGWFDPGKGSPYCTAWSQPCRKLLMGSSLWLMRAKWPRLGPVSARFRSRSLTL